MANRQQHRGWHLRIKLPNNDLDLIQQFAKFLKDYLLGYLITHVPDVYDGTLIMYTPEKELNACLRSLARSNITVVTQTHIKDPNQYDPPTFHPS